MKVTYQPEGSAKTTWQFDHGKLRSVIAEAIEKRWRDGGGEPATIEGWNTAVMQGSARAIRILLWFLLRQANGALKFDDVDPMLCEVEVSLTSAELKSMREAVAASPARTADEKTSRADKLEQLDNWIEQTIASEAADGVEVESKDPTTPAL